MSQTPVLEEFPVRVDIWSDVVCPWCAIGKRRFEAALAEFPHRDEVEVVWRSFQLDPAAPKEREDRTGHLAAKYGVSRAQAEAMEQRMTEAAAEVGLEFHFERTRDGNTFDAHRLLHLAREHHVQDALKERLLVATVHGGRARGRPRGAGAPRGGGGAASRRGA
jgi:predicted DsbA family dithiol-disulfide isomerase